MELLAAILFAGPLGYFARSSRSGLLIYLVLWAVIFPIQTIVVFSESDDGGDALYWVFNALILALGIVLNRYGRHRRERRDAEVAASPV